MTTHEDFLRDALGLSQDSATDSPEARRTLRDRVNLDLLVHGLAPAADFNGQLSQIAGGLVDRFRERMRLLEAHRSPIDERINAYLKSHLADLNLSEPIT